MRFTSFTLLIACALTVSCNSGEDKAEKVEPAPKKSVKIFTSLSASETGVSFVNSIPLDVEAEQFDYRYTANGGGVAVADFSNDGLPDIYFTANLGPNRLYLNKGNLTFEDISVKAGVASNDGGWNTGVTWADVNADGWNDIYVTRSGDRTIDERANLLFINQQDGTFKEEAEQFGLNDKGCGTQAAFFDYDLDGDLDVYVMNHPIDWNRRGFTTSQTLDIEDRGINSDKLYRNDNGKFVDVSEQVGLVPDGIGYGLGLSIGYLNGDEYPDIFVGNDYYGRDYLYYYNPEDGKYEEVGRQKMKHMSFSSMGSDISDIDNDGDADIIVMEMNAEDNFRQKTLMPPMDIRKFWAVYERGQHFQYMYNALHANVGNGFFSEVGQMAGISNTDWSWSVLSADYDLDGLKDLYITNGYPRDINDKDVTFLKAYDQFGNEHKVTSNEERLPLYKVTPLPNYAYKNEGDLQFNKISATWGLAKEGLSMGAAYVDLDNDGDLDLVVNNYNDTALVYRNDAVDLGIGQGLTVNLTGTANNTNAIGARITLTTDKGTYLSEVFPVRGYQSSVPATVHFGYSNDETPSELSINWPDGKFQTVTDFGQSAQLAVSYAPTSDAEPEKLDDSGLFTNKTNIDLSPVFSHRENEYDDFEKEVLLPHRLSQFGPALGTGDLNNDGLVDVVVGGAAGQTSVIYMQNSDGTFAGRISDVISKDAGHEDLAVAIFDIDGDNDNDIYIGSGGNEHNEGSLYYQDRVYLNNGGTFERSLNVIPDLRIATRTLAPNDFDGDGDLDLLVGADHIPRKYGADAPCALLRNDNGVLKNVTGQVIPDLLKTGMINKAIWANIDGEGGDELILGGDWMALSVFKWNGSTFENVSDQTGVDHLEGWWSTIAAKDMDGDGDIDLLGGNLGLNYKYKASASEPFKLFAMDFDESGTWDIALGYFNQGNCYPVRGRQCSSEQIPSIKKKFATYKEFGSATIYDVYGDDKLKNALEKNATYFASTYFENDGSGKFTATELPRLAQVSSVNGIVVHDLNKDGLEDVIIAGNLFQSEIETPRNDASNGLVMLNKGGGKFEALEGNESGFFAPYDVKELAAVQTKSGLKVFVANNNGPIELFSLN